MLEEVLTALDSLDPEAIDFSRSLLALEDMAEPGVRGSAFEKFLVALLKREGLKAWLNPDGARPRQTDAMFEVAGTYFVVEAKWRNRPTDIDGLDALRSRIQRCTAGTGGCLVSMEGFTSGVVNDLRENRTLEIVLVDGSEIRAAALGDITLSDLVAEKRKRFRVDGDVWFSSDEERRRVPLILPPSRHSIRQGQVEVPSIAMRTGHHFGLHFLIEGIDLEGWSHRAQLDLEARPADSSDLARILSLLHDRLQLGEEGSFAVHQQRDSWFGFGAEGFVATLQSMTSRYARIPDENIHHSEDASFLAPFSGGLLVVTTRQRVGENPRLHSTRIELLLNGIPLDLEPFRLLAREIDGRAQHLRVLPEREDGDGRTIWLAEPPLVEAVALILGRPGPADDDDTVVQGLVVRNPFFSQAEVLRGLTNDAHWGSELAELELLVCWLRSTHGINDKAVGGYRLLCLVHQGVGSVQTLEAQVDWTDLECNCDQERKHEARAKAAARALQGTSRRARD